MISIKNVSKWYGDFPDDCSTEVAKGEVVVVCGPSGSGKSTLIKVRQRTGTLPEGRHRRRRHLHRRSEDQPRRSCARGSAWCSSISSCFPT
ncbi:ATP-binding cassette domain-containing protein [Pseudomonas aeruginosa]